MNRILLTIACFTALVASSKTTLKAQTLEPAQQETFVKQANNQALKGALHHVLKLQPQQFTRWEKGKLLALTYGFMADELEKVYPHLVYYKLNMPVKRFAKDPLISPVKIKQIDYQSLIPILVAAIQEQQAIIQKQQEQIEQLLKVNTVPK